jgi:hypothetical protein
MQIRRKIMWTCHCAGGWASFVKKAKEWNVDLTSMYHETGTRRKGGVQIVACLSFPCSDVICLNESRRKVDKCKSCYNLTMKLKPMSCDLVLIHFYVYISKL